MKRTHDAEKERILLWCKLHLLALKLVSEGAMGRSPNYHSLFELSIGKEPRRKPPGFRRNSDSRDGDTRSGGGTVAPSSRSEMGGRANPSRHLWKTDDPTPLEGTSRKKPRRGKRKFLRGIADRKRKSENRI